MDKKTIQAVKLLNKILKETFKSFKGAYLYGSRTTGNASPDSDIDIVALFEIEPDRSTRMEIWGIVGKIEAKLEVFIDLFPMTQGELEKNPVYYNEVVNKGVFYDAA